MTGLTSAVLAWSSADTLEPARERTRRAIISVRAPAREYGWEGPQQDPRVERERPLVDVLEVELHPVIEAQVAAATDLPESCDTLGNTEAANEPCFTEVGDVARRQRTWPDE